MTDGGLGDGMPPPMRLMNFVSEDQLEEARRSRGARVDDGTAQRDRSLYDILKENKDKKDAEFTERFKHRPPKALDEDETEFLDKLEMSRREYEQSVADEEAQELQAFQAAVAAQGTTAHELKDTPPVPKTQDQKLFRSKNPPPKRLGMMIKVKPQAKKAKTDLSGSEKRSNAAGTSGIDDRIGSPDSVNVTNRDTKEFLNSDENHNDDNDMSRIAKSSSLVSYSDDESED